MSILSKLKWRWDGNDDKPAVNVSRRQFLFMGATVGLVAAVAPKLLFPRSPEHAHDVYVSDFSALRVVPNGFRRREYLSDVIYDISPSETPFDVYIRRHDAAIRADMDAA